MNWEIGIHVLLILFVKLITNENLLCNTGNCGEWEENRKEIQKRGDICICIADSLCCMVETKAVKQLYSNKNQFKKKSKTIFTIAAQQNELLKW